MVDQLFLEMAHLKLHTLLVYPILLHFASKKVVFVKSLDIETQKEKLKALELEL